MSQIQVGSRDETGDILVGNRQAALDSTQTLDRDDFLFIFEFLGEILPDFVGFCSDLGQHNETILVFAGNDFQGHFITVMYCGSDGIFRAALNPLVKSHRPFALITEVYYDLVIGYVDDCAFHDHTNVQFHAFMFIQQAFHRFHSNNSLLNNFLRCRCTSSDANFNCSGKHGRGNLTGVLQEIRTGIDRFRDVP